MTSALRYILLLALAIAAFHGPLQSAANSIRELIITSQATIAPDALLTVRGTLDLTQAQSITGLPASGLTAIAHDNTLTGTGTSADPLSVVATIAPPSGLSAIAHDSTLTGTGTPTDPLGIAQPLYAIFEIPLGIHGAQWTDFEVKGSVNNFTGLAAEALCYFYGSAYGSSQSTHGPIGTTVEVYYTDDLNGSDHGAARQYRRQDRSKSILEQKTGRIGGILLVVAASQIIRPENPNLAFVYQRVSAASMEECWVPIYPRWSRTYPHIP